MKAKSEQTTVPAVKSAIACAVAAAVASPVAIAQDTNPLVIEEITVVATKRESSVQDLAVSVTAIDGNLINELNLVNVIDLDKTVPGLKVRYIGAEPTIIMRGAGAAGTNDLAVPIYVDSLYRPRAGQALASYLDLERVEVLRGPQGTLFGRNTFGGLVNYISRKPSTEGFDFGASASFGDYSLQKFEGFVNVPLGDTLAFRLTASDTQRDPIIENVYNPAGGLRDEDNTYARAQLRFEPNDRFDITLAATYWEDTSNGNGDFAGVALGIPVDGDGNTNGISGIMQPRVGRLPGDENTSWPAAGGRYTAGVFGVDETASILTDVYKIRQDVTPVRDIEETSFSINANFDFGPAVLTVNYGIFDYEEFRTADSDYTPNPSGWAEQNPGAVPANTNGAGYWQQCWDGPWCGLVAGNRMNSEAYQADINLNSSGDGPLQWTLGYFIYDDSGLGDTSAEFTWAYVDSTNSSMNQSWAHWLSQGVGGTKSTAIYGQAEYSFTDRTRLTVGLRESTDERNSEVRYVDFGPGVHGWAAGYYDAHFADPGSRFDPWPSFVRTQASIDNRQTGENSNTDYKVAIQHDLNADVMLFASASTGYIAGNIEGAGSTDLTDPNEVEAYEIGMKSTLLDGAMRLNMALYQNDYTGLTTSAFEPCGGSICAVGSVGGSMTATGLEVEMDWIASEALRIRAGLSLQDAELDEFSRSVLNRVFRAGGDDVVLGAGITDPADCDQTCSQVYFLSGQKARFSPDYTLSVDATYSIDLGGAGELVPGILLYYSDDYKTTNIPYFFSFQDAYTTIDLRATWYAANSPLSIQAYVLNATDETVQIGSDQFSQGRAIADFNNPMTWGLRLSYNF